MTDKEFNYLRGKLLGATGGYPQGHFNDDEGELRLGIGVSEDKVIIHFGKSVTWIGFDADQAIELACQILGMAKKIKTELDPSDDIPPSTIVN